MKTAIDILRLIRAVIACVALAMAADYAINGDYEAFYAFTVLTGAWLLAWSLIDILTHWKRQSPDTFDWVSIEYRQQIDAPDVLTATLTGAEARRFAIDYHERHKRHG